jgi:hypothetical protein
MIRSSIWWRLRRALKRRRHKDCPCRRGGVVIRTTSDGRHERATIDGAPFKPLRGETVAAFTARIQARSKRAGMVMIMDAGCALWRLLRLKRCPCHGGVVVRMAGDSRDDGMTVDGKWLQHETDEDAEARVKRAKRVGMVVVMGGPGHA